MPSAASQPGFTSKPGPGFGVVGRPLPAIWPRHKPAAAKALQLQGSQRSSAKLYHSAQASIASLYHHSETLMTLGCGSGPGA